MKVFVFGIRGFPWIGGGAERHSEELYPRLVKMGCDVTVLTRQLTMNPWKGVKFKKIKYINTSWGETLSHSIMCTLYCLKHKPDVVHIHNMAACPLIWLLPLRGIRVVLTIHSLNYLHEKWGSLAKWVLNTCEFLGINFADKLLTVSMDIVKHLRDKYRGSLQVNYVANGVSKPQFKAANTYLKKVGVEKGKYILCVGRVSEEKQFDKVVVAYKLDPKDYKLVIVGGVTHPSLWSRNLMAEKNNYVKFTGFVCGAELQELFTNTGLFVSYSSHEGFPLCVLEAMSYELPILLSDISAHRQLPLHTNRYCNPDNIKELSLRMNLLMEGGIAEEEKDFYRRYLKEHHDWDVVARQTYEFYT